MLSSLLLLCFSVKWLAVPPASLGFGSHEYTIWFPQETKPNNYLLPLSKVPTLTSCRGLRVSYLLRTCRPEGILCPNMTSWSPSELFIWALRAQTSYTPVKPALSQKNILPSGAGREMPWDVNVVFPLLKNHSHGSHVRWAAVETSGDNLSVCILLLKVSEEALWLDWELPKDRCFHCF